MNEKLAMNRDLQLTDADMLRQSVNEPWVFGILLEKYQKAFLRRAAGILRSQDAAEDAVQETFIKIYKNAHKFKDYENASFKSWAYKILTNTCYTYAVKRDRDSKRVKSLEFSNLDVSGETSFTLESEQASLVESVLRRLPRRLSRLLELYFFEDKSYEEIAAHENITLSAARSGLYRARKQFKDIALKMTC